MLKLKVCTFELQARKKDCLFSIESEKNMLYTKTHLIEHVYEVKKSATVQVMEVKILVLSLWRIQVKKKRLYHGIEVKTILHYNK